MDESSAAGGEVVARNDTYQNDTRDFTPVLTPVVELKRFARSPAPSCSTVASCAVALQFCLRFLSHETLRRCSSGVP